MLPFSTIQYFQIFNLEFISLMSSDKYQTILTRHRISHSIPTPPNKKKYRITVFVWYDMVMYAEK
jgi:hypothetical protein